MKITKQIDVNVVVKTMYMFVDTVQREYLYDIIEAHNAGNKAVVKKLKAKLKADYKHMKQHLDAKMVFTYLDGIGV